MANALNYRPWRLDTVGVIFDRSVKVWNLYWFRPTDTAHTLVIKNKAGLVVFEGQCEVANQSQYFRIEDWWDGVTLDTLGSGVLYVYFQ